MTNSKEKSGRSVSPQTRSVANHISQTAVSLPAVPAISEQKEEVDTGNEQIQLRAIQAGEGAPALPSGTDPKDDSGPGAFKPVQRKNDTGMPDDLKSGVENISGYDMSDVKVHYNSAKPAQLQAHAYAQGSDIHIAPGQEKHLAHEAWHVVQQKQGRVKPTLQMKQNVPVNDDAGLESEADRMGAMALQAAGNESAVQRMHSDVAISGTAPVQRMAVTIKGVRIGKTRIYNMNGNVVGHIAKGTQIDIDENTLVTAGSRTLAKITSGGVGIIWNNPEALLNDESDLWISNTRYTAVGEEEADEAEAEEAPSLSIPLFGQTLKIGTDSAELSGSVGQSIGFATPDVNLSFDFPLPVPGVYATVGLGVGMNFDLGVNGAYEISASGAGQKIKVNATANGNASMEVSVNVGAGAGIANIAGVEGGLFAGAQSEFGVEGSVSGEIERKASKDWASSTLELKLSSSASLVGSAGTYIKAKLLRFSKEKKFKLLEKEFAKWEYERTRSIQKDGVTIRDIIPTVADFKLMLEGHDPGYFAVEEDMRETASLLRPGERSDS